MNNAIAKTLYLSLALMLLAGKPALAVTSADTVAINGKIYTVNPKQPWAEAVTFRGSAERVFEGNLFPTFKGMD